MNNYELYLKRYCKTYQISEKEAEQHLLVKLVKEYYEEESKNKV